MHSKLRNKLAPVTVEKLVFVRTNQAIIDKFNVDSADDLESDYEV